MLNYIWAGMIILSVLYGMATGRMEQVGNGAIESTKEAVSMCITMLGIMSMWMGFMNVASKSGIIKKLEKLLEPIIMWLFPGLPHNHNAREPIVTNIIANILGLGWAATPAGLKAMECLKQEQEGILSDKKMGNTAENVKFRDRRNITERQSITARRSITASREMCTFLIINISSLQLIPVNIIAYRMQYGSAEPTAVVAPAIVATAASTVVAVIFCKIMDRRDVA